MAAQVSTCSASESYSPRDNGTTVKVSRILQGTKLPPISPLPAGLDGWSSPLTQSRSAVDDTQRLAGIGINHDNARAGGVNELDKGAECRLIMGTGTRRVVRLPSKAREQRTQRQCDRDTTMRSRRRARRRSHLMIQIDDGHAQDTNRWSEGTLHSSCARAQIRPLRCHSIEYRWGHLKSLCASGATDDRQNHVQRYPEVTLQPDQHTVSIFVHPSRPTSA